MKRIITLVAIVYLVALATAIPAQSLESCKPGNGTTHCYDVASLSGQSPRALIYSVQLAASMKRGFATAEGWATWPSIGGQFGDWIEAGLMVWPVGEKGDLHPHAFYATQHEGAFYAVVQPWAATTASAPRYYFAISDDYSNGCYRVKTMLSPESEGWSWKTTLASYCGRPGLVEQGQVGSELETEAETRVSGKSEVIYSNDESGQRYIAGWYSWPDYRTSYSYSGRLGVGPNVEGGSGHGPGSLSWYTALAPLPAAAMSSASVASVSAGMIVESGKRYAARLKLTPLGGHKPTGNYRATIRDGLGRITAEYVGDAYPNETLVARGGQ